MSSNFSALFYEGDPFSGRLFIIDQTRLPVTEELLCIGDLDSACEAILSLRVRGAPLLGVFSLYAFTIGIRGQKRSDIATLAHEVADRIISVRPTAVNVRNELASLLAEMESRYGITWKDAVLLAHTTACNRHLADVESCDAIARHGSEFVRDGGLYITHCNTGSFATSGIGTGLGILKHAYRSGKKIEVLVPETRPLLQGSRLTAYELKREGIPFRILCEGALPSAYREFRIDGCFVGADRISANGDTANKVGTSLHALLCREYGVPFYVAAPMSSFDFSLLSGSSIPIEYRSCKELESFGHVGIAPTDSPAYNPAFDITEANLITAIISDKGVMRPPL